MLSGPNAIRKTPVLPKSKPLMSAFWLCAWSLTLAVAWLLPNHYLPWTAFHSEFAVAIVLALACGAVIFRVRSHFAWHRATVLTGFLIFLPWVQMALGMIDFVGTAWIYSLYLLGLLLALLMSAEWELASPGQLADGLFLAIGLAALASVGMQLHQWLGLDGLEVWVMPDHFGRPFANFGQPNQLATFLLWGLLALAWGWARGHVGAVVATGAALYLLFGLALTHSRTGWLATTMLVPAFWYWRRQWPNPRLPWVVTALALCFFAFAAFLGELRAFLLLAEHHDLVDPIRMSTETRPTIWALFIDAILRQPMWGYGWGQTLAAQTSVAVDHPSLGSAFGYAHNIFIEFIVWSGIPIGVMLSLSIVVWLWRCFRGVRDPKDVLLLLFLLVVFNHAMLELPLHYAYMLLPAGLIAGMLHVRLGAPAVFHSGRRAILGLWGVGVAMLALLFSDYAQLEPAYLQQRFEMARIKVSPQDPVDVRLLTQLQAHLGVAKLEPSDQISPADLEHLRKTVTFNPGPATFQKLATALALNGHPEEAGLWLRRLCKMAPEMQCLLVQRAWERMARTDPRIAAVPWPN